MAALYGAMKGARGETTRLGHSHISAHLRSWKLGGAVEVFYDKKTDITKVVVYATNGSDGGKQKKIFEFTDYEKIIPKHGVTEALTQM